MFTFSFPSLCGHPELPSGVRESSVLVFFFFPSVVVFSSYDAMLSSGCNGQFDLLANTEQICEKTYYKPREDSWGLSAEQNNFPWLVTVRTRLGR